MESEKRVVYWPGVVLVGLITLCSVFTIALGMLMFSKVGISEPGGPLPDSFDWECGTVRHLAFNADLPEGYDLSGEGYLVDAEMVSEMAWCRERFAEIAPSVVAAGVGSLVLFISSAVMFTVQVRAGIDQPLRRKAASAR